MNTNEQSDNSEKNSDTILNTLEGTEEILFELSNSQRLMIMFKLKELTKSAAAAATEVKDNNQKVNVYSLSRLSKELGLVVQEVHRNAGRLIDCGLISKDANGDFFLTTFGDIILSQLYTLSFLAENRNYFLDHTLGDLPSKFVQRIGTVMNSTPLNNSVTVFEHQKELFKNADEYIKIIISEIPSYLIELTDRIIENKVRLAYLLPRSGILPRKRHTETRHEQYHNLLRSGVIQRRMTENMNVGLIMSEKEAMIQFPKVNTSKSAQQKKDMQSPQIDTNSAYYSRDLNFHEWCSDYFDYKWTLSKTFDTKKLIEV